MCSWTRAATIRDLRGCAARRVWSDGAEIRERCLLPGYSSGVKSGFDGPLTLATSIPARVDVSSRSGSLPGCSRHKVSDRVWSESCQSASAPEGAPAGATPGAVSARESSTARTTKAVSFPPGRFARWTAGAPRSSPCQLSRCVAQHDSEHYGPPTIEAIMISPARPAPLQKRAPSNRTEAHSPMRRIALSGSWRESGARMPTNRSEPRRPRKAGEPRRPPDPVSPGALKRPSPRLGQARGGGGARQERRLSAGIKRAGVHLIAHRCGRVCAGRARAVEDVPLNLR